MITQVARSSYLNDNIFGLNLDRGNNDLRYKDMDKVCCKNEKEDAIFSMSVTKKLIILVMGSRNYCKT